MSDEGRKTNKHYTGTVPKVRQRNNISPFRDQENLVGYWQHASDPSGFTRNPRRNQRNNYFTMNSTIEENGMPQQNGCTNMSVNGSPSTSLTTSRRNSSGSTLKCDNVSKYPDKKQIEDKLHQIREYLKLMTTMKNTDEQLDVENTEKLLNDLKDSEKKLVDILEGLDSDNKQNGHIQASENDVEELTEFNPHLNRKNEINLENARQEAELLKEQQFTLLQLQQKAENKLRDARKITGNFVSSIGNQTNGVSNTTTTNDYADFDMAIRELEEKTKTLGPTAMSSKKMQENILARVESLHNQIVNMHDANEEREKLIEAELHSKLVELQNKKSQVDQLVTQLQTFANEEEEEDIGVKVRNIVAMKDQLNKLQDMLEVVKSAETTMTNSNTSTEAQAVAMDTCLNIESILEKDNQKPKLRSTVSNDSNVLRYDNDTSSEGRNKQTNKNKKDQRLGGQNSALQSELEIKKRELEELMGKHKASTSNLNHDVGLDIKSEFSYNSNTVNEAWPPVPPSHHHQTDSDRFSSRNEDSATSPALVNCCPSKYRAGSVGAASDRRGGAERRREDRNVRSGSVPVSAMAPIATAGRHHLRNRSNNNKEGKTQKQLQLIKSVCESMLEQDKPASIQAPSGGNVRQLRNDLTPSPLYSARRMLLCQWMQRLVDNKRHSNSIIFIEHTQSVLSMLWLQQRELAALRSAVTVLQERLESGQYGPPAAAPLDQHHMPTSLPPEVQRSTANLYRYGGSGAKTNQAHQQQQQQQQVSAAFSMPNLNHFAASPHPHHVDSPAQVPSYAPQVPHHGLNNHQELPNNAVLPPPANQMWLNNQIAPGNRANNYWDNFRRHENIPPPDVLNVNQNTTNKSMDHLDLHSNEPSDGLQMLLNLSSANDNSSNHSNLSEDQMFKECVPEHCRRRNESKLFEELRENVYKEVASLISANETRPEFLIQLFRDLRMIGNDSLRLKILQSIQMVITHSLAASQNHNRLSTESHETSQTLSEQEATQSEENFSFQTTVWGKAVKNSPNDNSEYMNFLDEALPFLSDHEDDIFNMSLLSQLKQILLSSTSLREAVKDAVFLKHFSNVLDAVFEQYLGKNFIQFIHDNKPQNSGSQINSEDHDNAYALPTSDHQKNSACSQIDMEEEEEGAVGGIIERKIEPCTVQTTCDIDINLDFPTNAEGLDQVPTRLPTRVKSRSTTPSKGM
nr:unnamed protein product [Callosobruchus analis]